jgi:predicted O-methyltransferase YrrM
VQDRLESFSGGMQAVPYDDVTRHILDYYRAPKPLEAYAQEFGSHTRSTREADNLSTLVVVLRELGLLVPADTEEPVDAAAVFRSALYMFGIWQLQEEFVPALELAAALRPQRVLEIGTGWGGSLFSWAQVARPDAHLVSVDLPGGPGGGGYTREYAPRFKQFCFPAQRLTCVLSDSTDPAVVAHVKDAFDGPLDVLFLDGAHSYDAVSKDFQNYSPIVRPGGIVVFHDIAHSNDEDATEMLEVDRFWGEVKRGREHHEFVREADDGFHLGVGVIRV